MNISKKLSSTFMVANFIATVVIVSAHYGTLDSIESHTVGNLNFVLQSLVVYGVPAIIPFFAMTSGFFFYRRWEGLTTYRKNLKKRVRSLIIPYILASGLILLTYIPSEIFYTGNGYDITLPNVLRDWLGQPIAVQFWYLRDLILLVLISPLLFIPDRRLSLLFGAIIFPLWLFEIQPLPRLFEWRLINIETILFFWFGGFIVSTQLLERLIELKGKWIIFLCALYVPIAYARLVIEPDFDMWFKDDFTIRPLLLYKFSVLIQTPLLFIVSSYLIYQPILFLGRFTFFVYLFHNFPLSAVVTNIAEALLPKEYAFYLSAPLALTIVFGAAVFSSMYLTPIYNMLTGNRTSKIAERKVATPPAQPDPPAESSTTETTADAKEGASSEAKDADDSNEQSPLNTLSDARV